MKEQTFLRISLYVSILGVLLLFLLSFFFQYPLVAIQDISSDTEGQTVRIEGMLSSLRNTGQTYIFTVTDDTGSISVVLYSTDQLFFQKNTEISVLGTVKNYQCTLEIQATKITLRTI